MAAHVNFGTEAVESGAQRGCNGRSPRHDVGEFGVQQPNIGSGEEQRDAQALDPDLIAELCGMRSNDAAQPEPGAGLRSGFLWVSINGHIYAEPASKPTARKRHRPEALMLQEPHNGFCYQHFMQRALADCTADRLSRSDRNVPPWQAHADGVP